MGSLRPGCWKKKGLWLAANWNSEEMHSHAAIPFAFDLGNENYKIYFAIRDSQNISRIFSVDTSDFSKPLPDQMPSLCLDKGELGTFDDHGIVPSWVLEFKPGEIWMYYTGWTLGKTVPFYNFIGLATSHDGGKTFQRWSKAPIMERTKEDPFLTASPCVLREGKLWKMWYVSGQRWESSEERVRHYYNIRYAESSDGIRWSPRSVCIDFTSLEEYAIARPCVVKTDNGYTMWYSYRGSEYRIGMATSIDGINWERCDKNAGITTGPRGWENQMIAYAHVFGMQGVWHMLYNGNHYGKDGIALATLD